MTTIFTHALSKRWGLHIEGGAKERKAVAIKIKGHTQRGGGRDAKARALKIIIIKRLR